MLKQSTNVKWLPNTKLILTHFGNFYFKKENTESHKGYEFGLCHACKWFELSAMADDILTHMNNDILPKIPCETNLVGSISDIIYAAMLFANIVCTWKASTSAPINVSFTFTFTCML